MYPLVAWRSGSWWILTAGAVPVLLLGVGAGPAHADCEQQLLACQAACGNPQSMKTTDELFRAADCVGICHDRAMACLGRSTSGGAAGGSGGGLGATLFRAGGQALIDWMASKGNNKPANTPVPGAPVAPDPQAQQRALDQARAQQQAAEARRREQLEQQQRAQFEQGRQSTYDQMEGVKPGELEPMQPWEATTAVRPQARPPGGFLAEPTGESRSSGGSAGLQTDPATPDPAAATPCLKLGPYGGCTEAFRWNKDEGVTADAETPAEAVDPGPQGTGALRDLQMRSGAPTGQAGDSVRGGPPARGTNAPSAVTPHVHAEPPSPTLAPTARPSLPADIVLQEQQALEPGLLHHLREVKRWFHGTRTGRLDVLESYYRIVWDPAGRSRVEAAMGRLRDSSPFAVPHLPVTVIEPREADFVPAWVNGYHHNANATSRGIFISADLLRELSDDQLVFVLGHELGHALGEHLGRSTDVPLAQKRAPELEADRYGALFALQAGVRPEEIRRFFEWAERQYMSSPADVRAELQNDDAHPSPRARFGALKVIWGSGMGEWAS